MKGTKTGLNWKIVIVVIILGLLLFNWPSFVNDILPALKGGVSPLKENLLSSSIHPRNKLRSFLEVSIKIPASALSKRPETYTELYFTDHLSLPKHLEPETQYEFEFSVHNLEYKDFTYVYEATATDEKGEIILDGRSQLLLKHDETGNVDVAFQTPESFERIKISVNLVDKGQMIHFWGEREED